MDNYSTETTAHTLAFILGHLALFPDIQEKVYDETRKVWPDDKHVMSTENVCH